MCSNLTNLNQQLGINEGAENQELPPHILEERNAIIKKWYLNPEIKNILKSWKFQYRDLKDLQIEEDHKNDIFIYLLNQPIEFLRKLDDGNWLGYIYTKALSNKCYENSKKHNSNPHVPSAFEFLPDFHTNFFTTQEMDAATVNDLLGECISEVDRLPYLHRECILAYAQKASINPAVDLLNSTGVKITSHHKLTKLLTEARDIIQDNLVKKGIIEKKVPFVKLFVQEKRSLNGEANKIKAAKFMLRALGMLAVNYDKNWGLSDKLLYILLDNNGPVSSYFAYKNLVNKHEPELLTEKGERWILQTLGKYFSNLINSGIITKRRISDKSNETEYLFPAPIYEWLSKIIEARQFDVTVSGLIWQVYLSHESSKRTVEQIAAELRISVPDTKKALAKAGELLEEVFELRAINPLMKKIRH